MPCLDSSFIIDYWQGEYFAAGFLNSLDEHESIVVPTIVLYELYSGALLSDAPAETITSIASDLDWADPLPFGDGPAREAAQIRVALRERGAQINPVDLLIAGTARNAGMTLVTTEEHFDRIPSLTVVNPATNGTTDE